MIPRLIAATTGGALAALAAAPSLAQGKLTSPAVEPAPIAPVVAPSPTEDWTGPYVGGQLGWGWLDGEADLEGGSDFDIEGDGVIGGLTGGYRYDFGRWVVGGEVQYDWADAEFDEVDPGTTTVDDAGRLDNMWRAKGLAGYDAGPALIYGSLGWTRADVEVADERYDSDGWLVGAGVDYMLTDSVSVGGEVMYHQFDDFGDGGEEIDLDATTLQGKVTFRF